MSSSHLLHRRNLRKRLSWVATGVLTLVALVLGFVGFAAHFRAEGLEPAFLDVLYHTLQLFIMQSGAVQGIVGWHLQVARFLAPAVAAYAAVRAILALFAEQFDFARLRWSSGHVVVCGLGRKGVRLVEELRKKGERVVVIEGDGTNPDLPACRDLGAVVLQGNSGDRLLLEKARVPQARVLIAVTGDDGRNVETAVLAHDLAQDRTGPPLRYIVHVADPSLVDLFKKYRIFADTSDPFELEFFNTFEIGARVMLYQGGAAPIAPDPKCPAHLLIVGLGRLGRSLLRRVVKDWKIEHGNASELVVTIVDRDAEVREQWFRMRYPGLLDGCRTRFLTMDVHAPDFAHGLWLQPGDLPPVSRVFVCLNDDALGTMAALSLHRQLKCARVPIVVRMSEQIGFAALLGTSFHGEGVIDGLRAVGLLDISCTLDLVLGGWAESLARGLHQAYIQQQQLEGQTPRTNASMVPWDDLTPAMQESNRQEVAWLSKRLAAIGCEMVADTDGEVNLFEFSEEAIDTLARLEHERWCEERLAAGWRYGPQKDIANRRSPYLVPWTELCEADTAYNRELARRLPAVLAKVDYTIRRIEPPPA